MFSTYNRHGFNVRLLFLSCVTWIRLLFATVVKSETDAIEAIALLEHWCATATNYSPSSQFIASVYNTLAGSDVSLVSCHVRLATRRMRRKVPKRLTTRLLRLLQNQRGGIMQLGIGKSLFYHHCDSIQAAWTCLKCCSTVLSSVLIA